MKLEFPEDGEPLFSELTAFKTVGIVMNVFLLDPSSRLLSAFVWVSSSNTIGLYTLLDWNKQQYVFIDTGIECVRFFLDVRRSVTYTSCRRHLRTGRASCTRSKS